MFFSDGKLADAELNSKIQRGVWGLGLWYCTYSKLEWATLYKVNLQ